MIDGIQIIYQFIPQMAPTTAPLTAPQTASQIAPRQPKDSPQLEGFNWKGPQLEDSAIGRAPRRLAPQLEGSAIGRSRNWGISQWMPPNPTQ